MPCAAHSVSLCMALKIVACCFRKARESPYCISYPRWTQISARCLWEHGWQHCLQSRHCEAHQAPGPEHIRHKVCPLDNACSPDQTAIGQRSS